MTPMPPYQVRVLHELIRRNYAFNFHSLSDQVDWVNKYLNTPNVFVPPAQFFNKNNRAYPEFSAVGDRILMIRGQRIDLGAGTSASTPLAAALIALLNDARFELGKSSLGFLNPMLYKMYSDDPTTFNGTFLAATFRIFSSE